MLSERQADGEFVVLPIKLLMGLAILFSYSSVQAQDIESAKKCIGALNSFSASIENSESSLLSTGWLTAQHGSIGSNSYLPADVYDAISHHMGKKEDIGHCISVKVPASDIAFFLNAYNGYILQEPYKGLEQCMAAFLVSAPYVDRALGATRSEKVGNLIGHHLGRASSLIHWVYGVRQVKYDELSDRANALIAKLPRNDSKKRNVILTEMAQQCDLYGVPLQGVLDTVRVMTKE